MRRRDVGVLAVTGMAGAAVAQTSGGFTYTATAASEVLSFLATGTPSGVPPFALLDGVTLNSVPEPGSLALLGIGLIALAAVWGARKKAF